MAQPHRTAPAKSIPPEIDTLLAAARDATTNKASGDALTELSNMLERRHRAGQPIYFAPSAQSLVDKLARFEIGPGTK